MKRFYIIALLFFPFCLYAQYNGKKFSISGYINYTTSAEVYLSPYSIDNALRNRAYPVDNIISPSVELRYALTDDIFLGLFTEYMQNSGRLQNITVLSGGSTVNIQTADGFRFIPLELSAYYLIPFSTENFKFYMGGGAGIYLGWYTRNFRDVEVSTEERKFAYGIQVAAGMDYLITGNISAGFQMRFRDPQFTTENKYNKLNVEYNGSMLHIPKETFNSKINIDGISFLLGLAYHFQ